MLNVLNQRIWFAAKNMNTKTLQSTYYSLAFALTLFCAQATGQQESDSQTHCELPDVRDELAKRVEVDQEIRREYIESLKDGVADAKKGSALAGKMMKVDRENTAWLKTQVEQHGWLGKTLVGVDGARNAWLLVQHADQQPEFQKHCLELMNKMPEGEVSKKNVAYLTDRVLCAENKPQRYGTQVSMDPKTGKPTLKDVEDPENLDKRRASVGLGAIDEYLKLFENRGK